jgi:hypothetical protein
MSVVTNTMPLIVTTALIPPMGSLERGRCQVQTCLNLVGSSRMGRYPRWLLPPWCVVQFSTAASVSL